MAYTGNVPATQYTSTVKDTFNGDGSTTDFTLSRPSLVNNLEVFVENVQQEPTTAYTVSGTTLSFTSAPVSGTGNIYVIHRGQAVQTIVPPAGISLNATDATITGATTIGDGLTVDNDGATVATFDRATSDGTIIDLQKDGSTVGTIGVYDTGAGLDVYMADTVCGLRMSQAGTDNIMPCNADGSNSDNDIDLGSSTTRFKDLYLSGGVYLGGTGAANHLDDYEEGTWTPTYQGGFSSVTYGTQFGHYTKIGSRVEFAILLNVTASTRAGTLVEISLPFTSQSGLQYAGGGSFAYANVNVISSTSTNLPMVYISSSGTTLALYKTDGTGFVGTDYANTSPQVYIVGSYVA